MVAGPQRLLLVGFDLVDLLFLFYSIISGNSSDSSSDFEGNTFYKKIAKKAKLSLKNEKQKKREFKGSKQGWRRWGTPYLLLICRSTLFQRFLLLQKMNVLF